jgi:hypothetical protein
MDNKIYNTMWGDTTTVNQPNPWDQTDPIAQLDQWLKAQQQAQAQQTQYHQNHELFAISQRLDRIEGAIETLLNMLKLILGTQLEKEMKQKEEQKEPTSQAEV